MASLSSPPNVVVHIICDHFLRHRGLTLAPRGLSDDPPPIYDDDRIISDMGQFHYVRIDATRDTPRGGRTWVVILVLSDNGKYSHHGPDLRKLLKGIESERPAADGRLDEIIVVAEEAFFGKKNLTDIIREAWKLQVGGVDLAGRSPIYSAYPYYNFSLVVPDHKTVAPHRIMSDAEVAELLTRMRNVRTDYPIIFATDAPIVWNGGREGQIVEITRDSQTSGTAIFYRRIERGPNI